MNSFKMSLILLGLISTTLYLYGNVSLTGPFSAESQKLVQYADNPFEKIAPEFQKYADGIAFLRAMSSRLQFSFNFAEFNAPQNIKILTAPGNRSVIEALVQIITEKKPRFAQSHFEAYYDLRGDEDKFMLAKIALITNDADLFGQILKDSSQKLQDQMFVMILHEADLDNVDGAINFLKMIQNPDADDIDELGFTLLAIAAVSKQSPELTRYILKLKPTINFVMDKLYTEPYREPQTVLDLLNNAISHIEDDKDLTLKNLLVHKKNLKNLKTIRSILLNAGAESAVKKAQYYTVWDLD